MDEPSEKKSLQEFLILSDKSKMETKHLSLKKIRDFTHGMLKEHESKLAGDHLSTCSKCLQKAKVQYFIEVFDSWDAKTHGIAYTLELIKTRQKASRQIRNSYIESSSLKKVEEVRLETKIKELISKNK
jgi:hypothetical protein